MVKEVLIKKKSVVVFGCQQIMVDCIKILKKRDIEIPLVVTYELPLDVTYGYTSVVDVSRKFGVECIMPKYAGEIKKRISKLSPDVIFSIYYRKIFDKEILAIPRYGAVNIHPSMLPYYRGPVPTAWAILNGEKETGVTIHYMDDKIDTGDIIDQVTVTIDPNETGFDLYKKCMETGSALFDKNLDTIINGTAPRKKQSPGGSYYGKLNSKGIINWQSSTKDLMNFIRVHSYPYDCAETILFNRYIIIMKARPISIENYILQGPGRILDIVNDKIVVSTVDGAILLEEYEFLPALNEMEKEVYIKTGNILGK